MKILFIDVNIILDIFLNRKGQQASSQLLRHKDDERCILYTSSSCILTALYFLKKEKLPPQAVRKNLQSMLDYFKIAEAGESAFHAAALNDDFGDIEDGVLHYTAIGIKGIDGIVTRNTKDFKYSLITIYTPEEAVALIEE